MRRRIMGYGALALALATMSGCADDAGTRGLGDPSRQAEPDAQVVVPSVGPGVTFELDAFESTPQTLHPHPGHIALNAGTTSIAASVVLRDENGESPPLDALLAQVNVHPKLRLDFSTGQELELTGTPLLTQIHFDLEDATLPAGTNAEATLMIGGVEIGSGDVFHVARNGDFDGNGVVESSDLVSVLAAGKYDTGLPATWEQGDLDGNGVFDSSDLVTLLVDGGFEQPTTPLPSAPELVTRDYPPVWLADPSVEDAVYDQLDALWDQVDETEPNSPEEATLLSRIEDKDELLWALLDVSTRPDINYNNVDLDGDYCAMICWYSAQALESASRDTDWKVTREVTGECDPAHDDDCLTALGELVLECDPWSGHLDSGWLDGPRYQYTSCWGDDTAPAGSTGSNTATAECKQDVAMQLHCESFGKGCKGPASGTNGQSASCVLEETRDAELSVGANFSRPSPVDEGTGLDAGVEIWGSLRFAREIESEFGLTVEPNSINVSGIGISEQILNGLEGGWTGGVGEPDPDDAPAKESACSEVADLMLMGEFGYECAKKITVGLSLASGAVVECKLYHKGLLRGQMSLPNLMSCLGEAWSSDEAEPLDSAEVRGSGYLDGPPRKIRTIYPGATVTQDIDPLGISVAQRTKAETRAFEEANWLGMTVSQETSTSEAWTNTLVSAKLRLAGPAVGDAICMVARPDVLPEPTFLQEVLFETDEDIGEGRLGHTYGSTISLTCDYADQLFVVEHDVPVRCYDIDTNKYWECESHERCGEAPTEGALQAADSCL